MPLSRAILLEKWSVPTSSTSSASRLGVQTEILPTSNLRGFQSSDRRKRYKVGVTRVFHHKKVLLLTWVALAGCLCLLLSRPAYAATDDWPLHFSSTPKHTSRGPRVALTQFLIRDPRPKQNAFSGIKGTLKQGAYTPGYYGAVTARAVVAYKFRMGIPAHGQCQNRQVRLHGIYWDNAAVGPLFIALLRGKTPRPACWVAVAAKRLARAESGATKVALTLKAYELYLIRRGINESYGSNQGPFLNIMERYFGFRGQPWCAILQDYALIHVGLPKLPGINPFFVPEIINWGRRNLKFDATARVGEWVLYYGDISHIGYVIRVNPKTGFYWTYEGNWNSRAAEVYHSPYDHLHYFLKLDYMVK